MSGGEQEPGRYYVGVDVGTGSVRAALVDQSGILLAFADQPIKKWEPQFNHHEQSSEDIWAACCAVTKKVVQGIDLSQIRGLGFDATCSLVVLDKQFHPLPVNHEGRDQLAALLLLSCDTLGESLNSACLCFLL
uniref:Carbohydrate kinase FGGY N-terminal domain-containing protein n=1 Tax=Prolemur simus TaxID=1328070 RepID=A0A8C8Z5Z9_PROSS